MKCNMSWYYLSDSRIICVLQDTPNVQAYSEWGLEEIGYLVVVFFGRGGDFPSGR